MSTVTMERPTAEAVAELGDGEILAILDDSDSTVELRNLAEQVALDRNLRDGKADELRGEGGEPTGEMQKDPPADPLPDVDEIRIDGTAQLSMFNLGGKLPTSASLSFTGGKVSLVEGQAFNKGDRIKVTIEAVVNDIGQKDAHDPKTGQVVSCEQRHKARIVDMIIDSAG